MPQRYFKNRMHLKHGMHVHQTEEKIWVVQQLVRHVLV